MPESLGGADLRDTRAGRSSLGHRGGDPELTWIFNPELFEARADDRTRWPEGFRLIGTGVVYDGPHPLSLDGVVAVPPAEDRGHGPAALGSDEALRSATAGTGLVRGVRGWRADVELGGATSTTVPGDRLLARNLRLLEGQPAVIDSGPEREWWAVVGHDDDEGTLDVRRGDHVRTVPAAELFEHNARRWWWHTPGSEWTARD